MGDDEEMSALTDRFTLSNGVEIPNIGFGTWQIPDGREAYDAVSAALEAGYRHIDTARGYGNEASVGRAIVASGIPRAEVFVTTKLPAEVKSYDGAHESFEVTMTELGLDYVDLYLIHAPWPWAHPGTDHREGNAEAWRAMQEVHSDGRSRSIGISNFSVADIEALLGSAEVNPHVNQIRLHVGFPQFETTAYCQANGILVEAYSPLATGRILDEPGIRTIAERYGKSVAQVCIRYTLERGTLPLPKTTDPARMVENAAVDFEISAADMAVLDAITEA